MRQWNFIADMNFDGIVNAVDYWLWLKWVFFYPGDCVLQWMFKHAPTLAKGLELSSLDSFGGAGSGVISLWVFMFATMACESSVLRPAMSRRSKRARPVRRPHTQVVLGTHMRRYNHPARAMFGRQAPW